ncbi:UMP kinase [Candidatus Palibaumannia cicadellinicola]|uniref:Uridylate kinase n=1 Tax=Baumannia cicadellinicola subsp. Homalodisca coagulata TaxID=374463 RepID=PYRH_BAUCH|nr:UMP kinase [Candidatus Baumannia cicadellinicola]Q1LSV5.1 RecName: Full=Uridylate kinase; Short=UK; AltName: Full=Uridine monophosphate kinase; Short=UMP kinase; Short=UMPK [Baumannia cicadellinicola str. Hc (Homalodisca coagulata)]ABF13862.1 uridylate kinase [Baumannia cicadellinicola str. Hc (Homalodisca coagulata)]MCJ7462179.1 UMP kinase [Candidatus Baumannia cicadellinicola]MCJ7462799.1 UMP kinase [Candidatus Baumannia cicadellinicola]
MTIKPIYQRILLKLSGEALQGKNNFGIDTNALNRIVQEIKELIKFKINIGIVIGGGNLFRGTLLAHLGIQRVVCDHMGMLATVINSLAIRNTMLHININANILSAIPLDGICELYNLDKAIDLLEKNIVVIFAAGIGNPFFTTDSAACLRGLEIGADVVLKATKVDGVFSADPKIDPDAILYDQLNYKDILKQELKIMDLTALTLAHDNHLPIRVFNINKPGALWRVVMGKKEGTLIYTPKINKVNYNI